MVWKMSNQFPQLNTFTSGVHFSGDLVLQPKLIKGLGLGDEVNISAASGGVSSLTCAGKNIWIFEIWRYNYC